MADSGRQKSIFNVILVKPTHYDDDGYPLQWRRSIIPSNTLACVHGLMLDCIEREVLGPDVPGSSEGKYFTSVGSWTGSPPGGSAGATIAASRSV